MGGYLSSSENPKKKKREVHVPVYKLELYTAYDLSPYLLLQEFDRNVKSFVYILDGAAATTKMQLPKDSKNSCKCLPF